MTCEMCGSQTGTVKAVVEGVELNVCKICAKYGELVKKPSFRGMGSKRPGPVKKKPEEELIETVKQDYGNIVRKKREAMGLKQSEFAKLLAERESIIQQMESGQYKPSIELARKMEKILKLELVEQKKLEPAKTTAKKTTFTIGDMIKIK